MTPLKFDGFASPAAAGTMSMLTFDMDVMGKRGAAPHAGRTARRSAADAISCDIAEGAIVSVTEELEPRREEPPSWLSPRRAALILCGLAVGIGSYWSGYSGAEALSVSMAVLSGLADLSVR
jgi:anti-sigma factor RsiW